MEVSLKVLSPVPTHVDLEKMGSGGLRLAQNPECTVSVSCTCYGFCSRLWNIPGVELGIGGGVEG